MRITGGALSGRRVAVPEAAGSAIRPAMDRMRESVFATLGDITGKSFLDLFSGSGIIALEALSRGAEPVEAVEQDRRKSKTLIQNAAVALPLRLNCRFIACELYIQRARRSFDLIFCDPPFPYAYKSELLQAIAASPLAGAPESLVMLHRPREEAIRCPPDFRLDKRREYGRSVVDFLRRV
ncbi:MAG: RsmD family RNA methyltransferase [Spirochaetaceae bacterium]|jgi:16S rRNA (guanine(966)-N(2))-methyltransferase RsmD|nr:RsmD family RNA methyltransferase [Spirochaetaceae bacterium]